MEIATIKEVLMKPIGPTVGFVSQFLVMPLVSFESYKLFFVFKLIYFNFSDFVFLKSIF